MEIIKEIAGITFYPDNNETQGEMEGFKIITDKQEIRMGITNDQSCCESWGFFMSEDDLNQFIGAELHGVEVVDTCLKPEKLEDFYEGGTMFINFNTNRGLLQFAAYNSHNGYYGHDALIESKQLTHSESL